MILFFQFVARLGLAYLLALPIAWDRERRSRAAGLRTFPLVALASCGYVLLAQSMFDSGTDQARVIQGIITGVGFIGGGAIVKNGDQVEGTATATSLWITAAIGIAVASGRVDIAVILSAFAFVTVRYLTRVKEKVGRDPSGHNDA